MQLAFASFSFLTLKEDDLIKICERSRHINIFQTKKKSFRDLTKKGIVVNSVLYFCEISGLILHDVMILNKNET